MENELVFERNAELRELLKSLRLPQIKVVVGLRRAGKTYLLNELFAANFFAGAFLPLRFSKQIFQTSSATCEAQRRFPLCLMKPPQKGRRFFLLMRFS